MNFNTIQAGDRADMKMGDEEFTSMFVGFSAIDIPHSMISRFLSLKSAKAFYNVRNNAELEVVGAYKGYGYGVYAIFKDEDDDVSWSAYLFEGKWCGGSSATPIRFN